MKRVTRTDWRNSMNMAGKRFEPLLRLKRYGLAAGRWSGWAQSLSSRHWRVAERSGALALILAERARAVWNISRRWERYAWRISPQVYLSISPILKGVIAESENAPVATRVRSETQVISPGREMILTNAQAHAPASPLQQVLKRIERSETIEVSRRGLSLQMVLDLARRVVEERRRVEVRAGRGVVTRQLEDVSQPRTAVRAKAVLDDGPIADAMVFNLPVKLDRSSSQQSSASVVSKKDGAEGWSSPTPPQTPPINIERIAEQVMRQIDHRIVAYRERMGRPGF